MSGPTLGREYTGIRILERIQDHTRDAMRQLSQLVPLLGGQQVKNFTLQPGKDNQVPHSLGRVPLGYFVVGGNQPGVVYESSTTNNLRDSQLILLTSAAQAHTVSLWVF